MIEEIDVLITVFFLLCSFFAIAGFFVSLGGDE